jgi:hypothetical protein
MTQSGGSAKAAPTMNWLITRMNGEITVHRTGCENLEEAQDDASTNPGEEALAFIPVSVERRRDSQLDDVYVEEGFALLCSAMDLPPFEEALERVVTIIVNEAIKLKITD